MNEILDQHINEIKKLSYGFLLAIAKSKEPLTYCFVDQENDKHQVEVSFESYSEQKLEIMIALDSDWSSRFEKKSATKIFEVTA